MKIFFITAVSGSQKTPEVGKLEKLDELTVLSGKKFTEEEIIKKAAKAEILIVSPSGISQVTKNLLSNLPRLKFLTMPTADYKWIDIKTARTLGIKISNCPGTNSESVAEHIWALILNLAKRVTEFAYDAKEKGAFNFREYEGKEVYGKVIGIVGLGFVGKKVARIARGFEMKVLGVNKSGKAVKDVKLVPLETLFKKSDVIVLCVPLNKETKNLISKKALSLMKKGVILVNCSNEGVVHKKEVIKSIKTGKLFGYGGDLTIMKSIPKNDDYLKFSNIVVHSHNAFNTRESNKRTWATVVNNIKAFLAGKPQNLVN